ncbi:MarC family protein [Actinoplanes sp. GCM10030250]|uniref:MarC family protein n=1 Tax=Actinoplanes sp. GCM10030250 TaxID=3273376 RepID=UPI00361BC7F6
MSFSYEALVLFLALFALYSPVAALSSYLPIVRPYNHRQQMSLAVGLVVNVTVFVLLAIWVGEPLLELLGISTAALTATGGIALIFASVPLMRGTGDIVPASTPAPSLVGSAEPVPAAGPSQVLSPESAPDPRSVLFTPITFPLTVGGTTFAFGVAASADVGSVSGRAWLSLAAVAYAVVTGVTLYLSGHVERRVSPAAAALLDRVAGILLTAIAVVLLANGFTDLVRSAWYS